MIELYDDVVRALQSGSVNVKFMKVNGDFRDMTCTLEESVIGKQEVDPNGIFRSDLFERIFGDVWNGLSRP